MTTPTNPDRDRPAPPTVRDIAELAARLRELSARGRDVDPAERAAFLADKQALLDRIEDAALTLPDRYVPADLASGGWDAAAAQVHEVGEVDGADDEGGYRTWSPPSGPQEQERRDQLTAWRADDQADELVMPEEMRLAIERGPTGGARPDSPEELAARIAALGTRISGATERSGAGEFHQHRPTWPDRPRGDTADHTVGGREGHGLAERSHDVAEVADPWSFPPGVWERYGAAAEAAAQAEGRSVDPWDVPAQVWQRRVEASAGGDGRDPDDAGAGWFPPTVPTADAAERARDELAARGAEPVSTDAHALSTAAMVERAHHAAVNLPAARPAPDDDGRREQIAHFHAADHDAVERAISDAFGGDVVFVDEPPALGWDR